MNTIRITFFLPFLATALNALGEMPDLDLRLGEASASTQADRLTVSTGRFTRTWRLTPSGLRTTDVATTLGELLTLDDGSVAGADWEAKAWLEESIPARMVALTAQPSTDSGFTSRHIKVVAEFEYPEAATALRYVVWAYPGADGLRTQLWLRSLDGVAQRAAEQLPAFSLKRGRYNESANLLTQRRELVLEIGPLGAAGEYVLELDVPPGSAASQSTLLTSIDNETRVPVPAPDDDASPVCAVIVPELRPNGAVTIRIASTDPNVPARLVGARLLRSGKEVVSLSPAAFAVENHKQGARVTPSSHRADWLPVTAPRLHAIGYFNDTQNRHTPSTHLLREEEVSSGRTAWANILCLESGLPGHANLAVVKESHKCVNQTGVDTGAFIADGAGLSLTGFGVSLSDLHQDEWRWAWANWIVAYASSPDSRVRQDQRELAIKRFQRIRYPVRPELDLYIKANTWGSGANSQGSVARASEKEVLDELESVADLGLDTLQIDDGWQQGRMPETPCATEEWEPRPDWYPDGWVNVVTSARKKRIDLGIWHAARAPLAALKKNYDLAGFKTWKLDFANLSTYAGAHEYLEKGRELVEYGDHNLRVNWDVTEIQPRYGYFWASECGNLWLANRKPMRPASVVPRPWLMLREAREISRYLNLNKIELPIQNFQMVNREISDAALHGDGYSVALGLPGIPVFFQTTRLLSDEQRSVIRSLLSVYKSHRDDLFRSYVFPIGDEPDNCSWSGFQWCDPAQPGTGYLLVFRERLNASRERNIDMRFIEADDTLEFVDLIDDERTVVSATKDRSVPINISVAPGFRFLRYSIQ